MSAYDEPRTEWGHEVRRSGPALHQGGGFVNVGLMCDCPLPPMDGLTANDRGHYRRPSGERGCPQYAEDQKRGGRCRFCADAEHLQGRYVKEKP